MTGFNGFKLEMSHQTTKHTKSNLELFDKLDELSRT